MGSAADRMGATEGGQMSKRASKSVKQRANPVSEPLAKNLSNRAKVKAARHATRMKWKERKGSTDVETQQDDQA
jgi:hypothetical protein